MSRMGRQSGIALMEFALSFMVFWVILMGVIEFSRLMMAWGTAAEATRLAARLASTCDMGSTQEIRIRDRVKYFVTASGQIDLGTRTDWLVLNYLPSGCTADTCTLVEAKLNLVKANLLIPLPGFSGIPVPAYSTRVMRESMRNTISTETNGVCL